VDKVHILTLSIQEVADWHWMASIAFEGGVLKHRILVVALRTNTHILLTQMPRHLVDVDIFLKPYVSDGWTQQANGTYQLFRQWDLLELHGVHTRRGSGGKQRRGRRLQNSILHAGRLAEAGRAK
jgi:hypothetical protein